MPEAPTETEISLPGPGRIPTRATALIGRLWRDYLVMHWPWLLGATILMMIEGSTLGILSYTLQPMFDRVLVGREGDAIWLIGGGIMVLFCIRAVAGVSQRLILTRVAQIATTRMQTDLVAHMLTLDSQYYHDNAPGALIERVQGDTAAIQQVWQTLIQGGARDLIALVSLGVVAVSIDPVWTVVALVGVPVLVLPALILQHYLRRKATSIREISSDRSTRLSEIFHGIDLIKLNRIEVHQTHRFSEIVNRIVSANIKFAGGGSVLPGLLDVMTGVGFFAVLLFGGSDILSGEKTVGEFMSFFTAMALAFQPMRRIANMAGILQNTAASLQRLYDVFDLRPTIVSPAEPAKLPESAEVTFEDVTFSYGDTPALTGLSFTAEAGRTTALVGPSGAGKTTVFSLLTRLFEATGGQITVGGVPVGDLALEDLRGLVSIVSQDAPLFDESLRDNILLGRTDLSEADLAQALRDAALDEVVAGMPHGLDTRAGPRGTNLSGGQRQRVAIARALLRNTPILLLDEATSALDAKSEAAVQSALERLSKDRTTLVIAHRLATIQSADRIVVMERGRAVDAGTHEELLERGGLYASLYKLQFLREDGK